MSDNTKKFHKQKNEIPDFDHELEEKVRAFSQRFTLAMIKELVKENKENRNSQAIMIGFVYAHLTLIMGFFDDLQELGIDPSKEFPGFVNMFIGFLRPFEEHQDKWGKIPFKEFKKLFNEAYMRNGHFVVNFEKDE